MRAGGGEREGVKEGAAAGVDGRVRMALREHRGEGATERERSGGRERREERERRDWAASAIQLYHLRVYA